MYLSRFTIMVTDRSIEYYWGFRSINGTISIKRKKIEINNIRSINPELYSMPIFDYKTNFYGPKFENFYLISSLLTVKIITKDAKTFYLRTNDPMRIVNFVRKRLT